MIEVPDATFDVRVELCGGVETLMMSGDLDLSAIEPFRISLELLRPFDGAVVVDLSHVAFIDSSGLNLLLALRSEVHASGQELQVCGAAGATLRLFELSGLVNAFGICPSPDS